jgi:hypothetical protein
MEVWHISTILGKPVNPITAVDRFDEHQQELVIEWLRALRRKHAHDNSVRIDAKSGEVSHILRRANTSNGGDYLCFVVIQDVHGILEASMYIPVNLPIDQGGVF